MTSPQTEARAIARRLEALAEHLMLQPLTHADSVDIATIRAASAALAAKDAELAVQREAKEHARRLCDRAETALAEARKALEPFANEAMELADGVPDNADFGLVDFPDLGRTDFTVGDLRAARRALTGGKKDG